MRQQDFKIIEMKIEHLLEAAAVLRGLRQYQSLCAEHRAELFASMTPEMVEFIQGAVRAFDGMDDDELFAFFVEQIAERRARHGENAELRDALNDARANLESALKDFLGAKKPPAEAKPQDDGLKTMAEFLEKNPHLKAMTPKTSA